MKPGRFRARIPVTARARRFRPGLLWWVVVVVPAACGNPSTPPAGVVFQYSIVNALLAGEYDGELTIAGLLRHGDTGLGTTNGLDGELIVVDGEAYSIKTDGRAHSVPAQERTPFAVVAFINGGETSEIPPGATLADVETLIDGGTAGRNAILAFRIDGSFKRLQARSVPRQTRPYRPLADVVAADEVRFEFADVSGTIVGFRMPGYLRNLNVPGYHLHFLSADREKGGHVLSFESAGARVRVRQLRALELRLPSDRAFERLELDADRSGEVRTVEGAAHKR